MIFILKERTDDMNEQFKQALKELQIAQNHFENAEPIYFEAANAAITAAEAKIVACYLHEKRYMYGID